MAPAAVESPAVSVRPEPKRRLVAALVSPQVWVLVVLLAVSTVLQYLAAPDYLQLARASFVVPIFFAALAVHPSYGLAATGVSVALMLHAALFSAPVPADALIEVGGVALAGTLWSLYLRAQRRQREQKERTESDLARLRWVHQELQFHVDLVERNERRLAALHDISNLVIQGLDVQELLPRCLEVIASATNVEVVFIYLMNQERNELDMVASRGVGPGFNAALDRMQVGEGFNGRVAASGEPMLVDDMSNDPRLSRLAVKEEGLQATMIVPLKFKGTIVGTLCTSVRRARQFGPDEVALLTAIGNEVGVAIENARAHERQQLTLARLRASERNYRTLFESASDAILVRTPEGRILAANHACAELTGYAMDELTDMNLFHILRADGHSVASSGNDRSHFDEGHDRQQEWTLVRRDGSEATVALSTSSISMEGDSPSLQHVIRDITLEKRMEENMRLYVQQITQAQEEERKRVSRELHDDTMQVLSALSREVDNFIRKNPSITPEERGFLTNMRERLNSAVRDVRRFGQNLRPSVLDDLGLLPALNSLLTELMDGNRLAAELKVIGQERRFGPEKELLIFRSVQEAVSNIRRHAEASAAEVEIDFEPEGTVITITDNGRGFELPAGVHDLPRSGKLGLVGVQERVRLLGGNLHIESAPGKGTTLRIDIPA